MARLLVSPTERLDNDRGRFNCYASHHICRSEDASQHIFRSKDPTEGNSRSKDRMSQAEILALGLTQTELSKENFPNRKENKYNHHDVSLT